ncbi:hypothetical protein Fmac_016887 [Flemingia macrophylla]|uniref:Dehydrogenase E1 component domain-containing protein n=1 Tax=Flemingia macrophylla TaxID=520843 RepID=A0ABD1MIU4_9FABA
MLFSLSIGKQESCYGVVSLCKNLQASYFPINMIMGKEGKCQLIMGQKHNYFTVASTISTQISHGVGAAYFLKMDKKDACAVPYFGDGGSSEGDFHDALNFAAVTEAPGDGVVVKGQAYDALAIYSAVQTALPMALTEERPILIEVH